MRPHSGPGQALLQRGKLATSGFPTPHPLACWGHLKRFELGTAYTDIVPARVALRKNQPSRDAPLVVDQTGAGRPVLDMLRKARVGAKVVPLFVTAGKDSSSDERGGWMVSRQELASTLQVLLQSRRLRVAPALTALRLVEFIAVATSSFLIRVPILLAAVHLARYRRCADVKSFRELTAYEPVR